jgi:hypothetical protein
LQVIFVYTINKFRYFQKGHMSTNMIDQNLRQYGTDAQKKHFDAYAEHGSFQKAARALGLKSKNAVQESLVRIRASAARQGYAPGHFADGVAPGYAMGKVTVQRGPGGEVERTWERQSPDQELQHEFMRAAAAAMAEELPRVKQVRAPATTNAQLASVYTLTDSHVGAMCWHRENLDPNGDWDLAIAERTLTGCFEHMVMASPAARVGIVAQLGDFLHSDGMGMIEGRTPTSGHVLDQDGRFSKVVQTAIRILRRVIGFALQKHEHVVVLMAEGNHDLASSVWLRAMFKALYENEPRVEVIDSELPYYVYQHGEVMLAWHHGHLKKNDQLPLLFASQFPKVWGATTKRFAHTGHRHHFEEKEHSGMSVVQHSTLVSRDAYAARGGWMSERQCTAITYHSQFGQVSRNTVTPEMLQAA